MGLFDSFEEDLSSPPGNLTRVNVEELFDDPKYVSSTKVQVYIPTSSQGFTKGWGIG